MKQLKVGIVGLGLVSHSHLAGYKNHPRADIVAVCDENRTRAEMAARSLGIDRVFTSFDKMIEDKDIDIVDVATPTFLHAAMTKKAADHHKHVHCEKPFCASLVDGREALDSVCANGVKLVVGETYVFLTSHMKARELIEAGEIGRPLQIRQRHGAWLEKQNQMYTNSVTDRTWRIDPVKSGGGNYPWIFDHAVHFFSVAEYFMLDKRISTIYSVTSHNVEGIQKHGASHDPYMTAQDDTPIICWTYEGEECQGVWMRAERLNGKYDYMQGFSSTIIGEKGMIEVLGEGGNNLFWDGKQQHLLLHREGKETIPFRFDEGGDAVWKSDISYYGVGHVNQVHHLIHCIENDVTPRYSGENGLHAVRCTLSAIKSAQEKRSIAVSEIEDSYTAFESVSFNRR